MLRIIENPNDYQPKAVETAKTIFIDRHLSEEEIKIIKHEIDSEKQEKLSKENRKREIEDNAKNSIKSILDKFNPIKKLIITPERIIKIISILFGLLFIFQLYKEFGNIRFMFTDSKAVWDFSIVLYYLPFVVVPAATILFYKRKKIGH